MTDAAVLMMGMSAILLQIAALRELLTVFSGNELDIGITLAVWLLSVGSGGFLGGRMRTGNAFPLSFLAVALLAPVTFLGIGWIRPLLSLSLGESVSLFTTIITTLITIAPLGIVLGMQFPLAVSSTRREAVRVYSLDASGAFIGGVLITLILAGRISALQTAAAVSALNILTAAFLMRSVRIAALTALPLLLVPAIERIGALSAPQGVELIERKESRYGAIEVLRMRNEYSVYASGRLQFAYPDLPSEEHRAHVPMTLHPCPRRVLVLGGSPAVIRELLKHRPERIDFLEIDPELISVSLGILSAGDRSAAGDPSVRILSRDGRAFIKASPASEYDLVLLNIPEPATASINRFYTIEFFHEAKRALRDGGVLVLSLPPSFGYMSSELRLANGSVYRSLREVFGTVAVTAEEYGILAASDTPIETAPAVLKKRFSDRAVRTTLFRPEILTDMFNLLAVERVRTRLDRVDTINTDKRPSAYLYNLMVWADMQGGGMLRLLPRIGGWAGVLVIIPAAAMAFFSRSSRRAIPLTVLLAGSSSMAFSIVLLLAYQSMFGYVYVSVGFLTALFMAGIAVGGYTLRNAGHPLPRLAVLQAGAAAIFIIAPFTFGHEVSYYVVSALAGGTTGAEFAAAFQVREADGRARSAGSLYAADLVGSCCGALLASIVLVPLLGIHGAIAVLVVWKVISLTLLLVMRHENA